MTPTPNDAKARAVVEVVRPGEPVFTAVLVYWPVPAVNARPRTMNRSRAGARARVLRGGSYLSVAPEFVRLP